MSFEATVRPRGDRLEVTYRLTNRGRDDLLVVDLAPAPSGTPGAATAAAYVTGGTAASHDPVSTVVVSRRLFAAPAGAESAAPRTAGATVLRPGRTARDAFTVPVRRAAPYAASAGGPPGPSEHASRARFCLGVVAEPWPRGAEERLRGGDHAQLPHVDAFSSRQVLLCSARVPLGGS